MGMFDLLVGYIGKIYARGDPAPCRPLLLGFYLLNLFQECRINGHDNLFNLVADDHSLCKHLSEHDLTSVVDYVV
jgi:hypothetical protein